MKLIGNLLCAILLSLSSFQANAQKEDSLLIVQKYYYEDDSTYQKEADSTENYIYYAKISYYQFNTWKMHGKYESYFRDGTSKEMGEYSEGEKIGKWLAWHANGQLQSIVLYEKTKAEKSYEPLLKLYRNPSGDTLVFEGNGLFEEKYQSGITKEIGMYKEYKKDSTWRFNQPNGTLRFKLNWNNGEFANGTTYLTKAEKDEYTADSINYDIIEQPAQFIGGMSAFYSYVNRSIKYPQKAIDIGIEGRVILTFVINLKGHIEDIQVTRKIHPLLDAEAVRIVTNNQKWMPAIQKGLKVRQKTQLPITFKLQ